MQGAEVYWFDDRRIGGQCRVPAVLAGPLSRRRRVEAGRRRRRNRKSPPINSTPSASSPVTTTALRLEVQLQPNISSGILEWKLR